MGFQDVWIKLQLLYQKLFSFPWIFDPIQGLVKPHPKLESGYQWLYMPLWFLTKNTCRIFVCFSAHRISQLSTMVQNTSLRAKIELIYHILVCAISMQLLVTGYTVEKDPKLFSIFVNNILKLDKGIDKSKLKFNSKYDNQFGYGIAIILASFPVLGFFAPFLLPYDPINALLVGVLPDFTRHLISGLYFVVIVVGGAFVITSFLLITIIFSSTLGKCTYINLQCIQELTSSRSRSGYAFENIINKYFQLSWVMDVCNEVIFEFVPILAGNGIAICVGFNCCIISGRTAEKSKKIMALGCCLIVMCMYFLIYFLGLHASRPITHSTDSIRLGRSLINLNKIRRKKARCLRPIGFRMGAYFQLQKRTPLDVFSAILDYTITFVIG